MKDAEKLIKGCDELQKKQKIKKEEKKINFSMSNKDLLDTQISETFGVGFKDCTALDETKGNIEKSVEYLRKKGIAKASKNEQNTLKVQPQKRVWQGSPIIEINSETDFVVQNKDFLNFCKEPQFHSL